MKTSLKPSWAAAAICLLAGLALAAPAAAAKRPYEAYGSCASKAPYEPAHRCGYDGREEAKGTFVFKSNVGKRTVRVCQRITGVPFDREQQCLAAGSFAYKAVPFDFTGARAAIRVRVNWFVKAPGSRGGYAKVATARLRFVP
jgi:hypothetical protein